MKQETDFNKCWREVFERYNILSRVRNDGYCDITAEEIKKIKEPRLLTKIDHLHNSPIVFEENKLSILPINRGTYRIGNMDIYQKFLGKEELFDNSNVKVVKKTDIIETIDFNNITSEAVAINSLYVGGILKDFLSEDELYPTISGRMGSGRFDFTVNNNCQKVPYEISVVNAQIEIDGGFEGRNSFCIIEAKNNIYDDFLVRQLYYPYRTFFDRIYKKIRPTFLMYNNGIYHLFEYRFDDISNYNSISLVQYQKYKYIEDFTISLDRLMDLEKSSQVESEPENVPFPQADTFERVVSICDRLKEEKVATTKDTLTSFLGLTTRQTDYYLNAAQYLDLCTYDGYQIKLTEIGKDIENDPVLNSRNLKYANQILKHGIFKDCFNLYLKQNGNVSKYDFEKIMRNHKECHKLGESLYGRRSSTVLHWIKWIFDLQDDY